ncbi:MAG: division/cell wall cluster transcriptional repressor MraZ [Candidatus Omnitrophica bacterium]|nr:division/cell wall cluster transcriptional repressor MraZ [Candidatus Omnitrophota bacterium]MBU4478012.1 division/cell wall cluster transcriptional repressor MraZ [Candidatus Omnitrophota bacterium]MCG2703945.1 division/cell wall cluster transcriptional repressor MraZ [Candidatus Omnitrophota bacterium]
MFYGEFEHSLDKKSRVIIPAKFREALKDSFIERFFITRGLDGCLFIFTEEEWKKQEQKFKSLSFTSTDARRFNRMFFSGASEVICDSQGRMLIPQYLKEFAQIQKDVVIIGVSNRIEIWSKTRWKEFYENSRENFEGTAEKLMGLE